MSEQLQTFTEMLKEDRNRAKALFFSESFKEKYLGQHPEYQDVYHQLLMGRNREQILEEFLITAKQKKPVRLTAAKQKYQIFQWNLDDPLKITVKREGWGYIEGRVTIRGDFLSVEQETFTSADFEDGFFHLPVYLDTIPQDGSVCHVIFETVHDVLDMEVTYEENVEEKIKQEQSRRKKMFQTYVDFCTGRIEQEEFIRREYQILNQMPAGLDNSKAYQLARVHIGILSGEEEIGSRLKDAGHSLDEESREGLRGYYAYLNALYAKDEETIQKAVNEINQLFEEHPDNGFLLWLLINLDKTIAYDAKLQIMMMKEVYQQGDRTPLLQFEACCLFGETPELLHHLDGFELDVLEFAAKEELLSDKLIQRICFLISREKTFSESLLWLLVCIYEEYPLTDVLQGICALLIQGNCMEADCHPYYEKALEEGIQLIGLQEAYLRTIQEDQYPVLPQEILIYFSYSNTLSRYEQSYLYANVIKNRRRYQRIFQNYEELIVSFLAEELKEGRLNRHLSLLYHYYFEELLENEKTVDDLGNVLFYQELICPQDFLKKVAVFQRQKRQPDIKFLKGRTEYVEIVDSNALLVFFDQEENRYVGSAAYQLNQIWTRDQIQAYCRKCSGTNEHYLLYKSREFLRKQKLSEQDFPEVVAAAECGALDEGCKQEIFEKILDYYWKNEKEEELKEALMYVDWKKLPPKNRIHMIEYFIAGGLYEEALRGIQQYGYHFLKPELLKKVTVYALTTLSTQRSDMLIGMCSRAFEHGQYNSEIIGYLQKYFQGNREQMLKLWEAGKDIGMYQNSFVEEVLKTCIREGTDGTEFPVFAQYLTEGEPDQELADSALVEYVDYACRSQKELPELFYEQVGRKIDAGKKDWVYQGLYLRYYKGKELTDKQKRRIEKIRDMQIESGDIFPELFGFSQYLELPKYLYGETFIEYQAAEGLQMVFHYAYARGKQWKELPMKELFPGYYVTSAVIFADELNDYFITAPGEEKRRRKDIRFIRHIDQSKGSRFYELNEMTREKYRDGIIASMEQYQIKKSMVNFIKPMTGD